MAFSQKAFHVLIYFLLYWMEISPHPQFPKLPREFQNIKIEQYLRNERVMNFQLKCLLYNGPCDSIGKTLKREIPIFLKTQCRSCDEEQKALAKKFIIFLQLNYPKEWDDALVKYGKKEYSPEELENFEKLFGVKVTRDKNAPTRAPGQKPDVEALVKLVEEAKAKVNSTGVTKEMETNATTTKNIYPTASTPAKEESFKTIKIVANEKTTQAINNTANNPLSGEVFNSVEDIQLTAEPAETNQTVEISELLNNSIIYEINNETIATTVPVIERTSKVKLKRTIEAISKASNGDFSNLYKIWSILFVHFYIFNPIY